MQRNPIRIKSSLWGLYNGIRPEPLHEDFRRCHTQPRKRAALRAHRNGCVRKNVFLKAL